MTVTRARWKWVVSVMLLSTGLTLELVVARGCVLPRVGMGVSRRSVHIGVRGAAGRQLGAVVMVTLVGWVWVGEVMLVGVGHMLEPVAVRDYVVLGWVLVSMAGR